MQRAALKKSPSWCIALSVGAMWGITEATLGYVLHLLPVNIGFMFYYPIACFFLMTAMQKSGQASTLLLTACIAALLKLTNLALPVRTDMVINPAISIVFQGLAVYTCVNLFAANVLWRLMYMLYLALLAPGAIRELSVIADNALLVRFLLTECFLSNAATWLFIKASAHIKKPANQAAFHPLLTGLLIVTAIGLQAFFALN